MDAEIDIGATLLKSHNNKRVDQCVVSHRMVGKMKSIDIVNFAEKPKASFVFEMLTKIGWSYRIFNGCEWLSKSDPAMEGPVVLLIDKVQFELERLPMALKSLSVPSLLISLDRMLNVSSCLLAEVSDFILAPVYEMELKHRLESLTMSGERTHTDSVYVDPTCNPLADTFVALNIVGESPVFMRTLQTVRKVARCYAPVLICGETGTGKELVARAIHYLSQRCNGPFIPVNCGAFNDELILSELFGHEKGAFTGAHQSHIGLIEQAHMGTLFLDEVDSLSQKTQVALLRFLQEQEYRPLGSKTFKKSDVRIVAATNTDLKNLIKQDRFREDLYYRLDILSMHLPPLRKRQGDIRILAESFLEKLGHTYHQPVKILHPDMLQWMEEYEWPGNIRELENYIHRIYVLTDEQLINYPPKAFIDATNTVGEGVASPPVYFQHAFGVEKEKVMESFAKDYLSHVLKQASGNISRAAKKAGKERRTFARLLKRYGIDHHIYT